MGKHPCDLPPIEYGSPRFQHWAEWLAFQSLGLFFYILPLFLIKAFLKALIVLAKVVFKKRIADTLLSIQERLGVSEEESCNILDRSLLNFGWNWVCQISPSTFVKPNNIHTHGLELLEKYQSEGKGTVIAAMHLGLWEAVPMAMRYLEHPLAITVAVQHNPLVDRHLNRTRACDSFHHVLHNRLGIRHTLRYLKGKGTLVVLSDVDIGPSGVPLPFLGQSASTPKWPMELAIRTNSELIVGYTIFNEKGELHLHFCPLAKGEQETMDLGRRMNDEMSKVIQQYPEQWFWMQRRWKTPLENLRAP